jgi:hypothetical protein
MGKYILISDIINFFGGGRISKVLLILAKKPKDQRSSCGYSDFSYSSLLSEFSSLSNVQGNHFPIIFFQSILMK